MLLSLPLALIKMLVTLECSMAFVLGTLPRGTSAPERNPKSYFVALVAYIAKGFQASPLF